MPATCVAFNCTSGYRAHETEPGVSFHKFPLRDPERLAKWVRNLRRENFVPKESHKICSKHFADSEFQSTRQDSNPTRKRSAEEQGGHLFLKRVLTDTAVPTIFNIPTYLLKKKTPEKRPTDEKVSSAARKLFDDRKQEHLNETFLDTDKINSLDDIERQLECKSIPIPAGFSVVRTKDQLSLSVIDLRNENGPQITAALQVDTKLIYTLWHQGKKVEQASKRFGYFSEVTNTMNQILSWNLKPPNQDTLPQLSQIIQDLGYLVDSLDEDDEKGPRLKFLLEQLDLAACHRNTRKYSSELLALCTVLHASGPKAYRMLRGENLLTLPAESTLRSLTRRIEVDPKYDDEDDRYLKLRFANMTEMERTVILLIDEIYVAKQVEYDAPSGELIGLDKDNKPAGTVLTFMICSVRGSYRDTVAMFPVNRLTAVDLRKAFDTVKTHVMIHNPVTKIEEPLFLILDAVHNHKNIYNNFQRRKTFTFPAPPPECTGLSANFRNIEELYAVEEKKPLKIGHRILKKSLQPNNIQRSSVRLATGIFHESTRDALLWYTENEGKDWKDTAKFVGLITKLFNVSNVKNPDLGRRMRDPSREPILSSGDWQIQFLREFAMFLEQWHTDSSDKMSPQTFKAVRHTCLTLADLAVYCLDVLKWDYVLLGKFQSDPIERRFSWLRQLSGANYYISVKQVQQNEKRIRLFSLLRFSKYDYSQLIDPNCDRKKERTMQVKKEASKFTMDVSDLLTRNNGSYSPEKSDLEVLYYVCGCAVRSEVHMKNCQRCRDVLVVDGELISLPVFNEQQEEVTSDASDFLTQINRGGLYVPSTMAFGIGIKAWIVFQCFQGPELREKYFKVSCKKELFIEVVNNLLEEDMEYCDITTTAQFCENGHDYTSSLLGRLFNCMAKNLSKRLTDHTDLAAAANQQKIPKLQGQNAKQS